MSALIIPPPLVGELAPTASALFAAADAVNRRDYEAALAWIGNVQNACNRAVERLREQTAQTIRAPQ
jgi:hypothetical protein